jgi:tRNA-dihydrouridine synthase B
MKIRNINFENGVFLAPMAGVADRAFRHMCKKYGADGVVTEMISSKATVFEDKKTKELARIDDFERPCALQLFGSEPETMARAASLCMEFSPDIIDINMGCPVHKVVSSGDGSALMKNPALAYEIMKAVVDAVGEKIPVTVKIRRGFDKDHINAVEIALLAQKAGVDAVFVHARTREQMYAPPCEYSTIKDVKEAVSIPVIGNGDIYCAQDAARMISETGCDGVMIGRGALGKPWLLSEIESDKKQQVDILSLLLQHIELLLEYYGPHGLFVARKHIAWYTKGQKNVAEFCQRVYAETDIDKVRDLIRLFFKEEK